MDFVRTLVSKNKKRIIRGEYNLDLTYIYPNLIAMGFPSENLEGVYRNHMDDVIRFLDENHKDHYRVYNLCSERDYDVTRFHNRVAKFPFEDHSPPPIQLIGEFCEDVDSWLSKHNENVAVIHCKAGKGRTGVMICAYMIHQKKAESAAEALLYYGQVRTSDCKGVTIPSQKRYVSYYEILKKSKKPYTETTLFLRGIKFHTIPQISNLTPQIVIHKGNAKIYQTCPIDKLRRSERSDLYFELTPDKIPVCGDVLITVINKPKMMKKERMFQFWFNTFFVTEKMQRPNDLAMNGRYSNNSTGAEESRPLTDKGNGKQRVRATDSNPFGQSQCLVLTLRKDELDKANKDKAHKTFSPNFEVTCYFGCEASVVDNNQASGYQPCQFESDPPFMDLDDDHLSDTDSGDEDETGRESAV